MIFELPNSGIENRRCEIRLPFMRMEKGWIRFVSAAGRHVDLKPGLIELVNMSPGGCGFRSSLRFPVSTAFLMMVECRLENVQLKLPGQIRWRSSEENGYVYGMRFFLEREDKQKLQCLLNQAVLTMYPGRAKFHRLYRRSAGGTVKRIWK